MCVIIYLKDQDISSCGELSAFVGKELVDKYHIGDWEEDQCLCGISDLEGMASECGYVEFSYTGDVTWVTQKHVLAILANVDVDMFAEWTNIDRQALLDGQFDPVPRILFLDIDGVLNNTQMSGPANGPTRIDPKAIKRIQSLLDEFEDLRIVVSSSKRYGLSLKELQELLSALPTERIIDITPIHSSMHAQRGDEIKQWLNGHPEVEFFVILDDNNDMRGVQYYLVQTSEKEGLQDEHLAKCRVLLTN